MQFNFTKNYPAILQWDEITMKFSTKKFQVLLMDFVDNKSGLKTLKIIIKIDIFTIIFHSKTLKYKTKREENLSRKTHQKKNEEKIINLNNLYYEKKKDYSNEKHKINLWKKELKKGKWM